MHVHVDGLKLDLKRLSRISFSATAPSSQAAVALWLSSSYFFPQRGPREDSVYPSRGAAEFRDSFPKGLEGPNELGPASSGSWRKGC